MADYPFGTAGQQRWFASAAKARCSNRVDTHPLLPCLGYKQKWPPEKTATHVVRKGLELLSFQEASRDTQRTEGRAEQHYRRAAIGNALPTSIEDPARKAMSQGAKLGNPDNPS